MIHAAPLVILGVIILFLITMFYITVWQRDNARDVIRSIRHFAYGWGYSDMTAEERLDLIKDALKESKK